MIDFKRGVSAKDLRPFSVEDPLGQRRTASVSATRPAPPYSPSVGMRDVGMTPPMESSNAPAAAARVARIGCLLVTAVWVMGLVGGAAAWLPRVVEQVRPVIERLITEWERREHGESATDPPSAPGDPLASPQNAQDAPPSGTATDASDDSQDPAVQDGPSDPGSRVDPNQSELTRVCERTVACCLTVQGERARSICENFRRMPTVQPCQESYEVFAQVGRQLGRACE